MGNPTAAPSRNSLLRLSATPEAGAARFVHGSIIAQLENDQLIETQGDEAERAFRRGHNHGIRHALDLLRIERGLAELRQAPVIRTVELEYAGIDLRLRDALGGDE